MTHCRPTIKRRAANLTFAVLISSALVGCSTHQVSVTLEGSTAQRLVTYSLDKFIKDFAQLPEVAAMKGKKIHLGVHFLEDHPLMDYATLLIAQELQLTHDMTIATRAESSEFEMDVFFNSLGTDSDQWGLTVPTLGFVASTETVNVLALDMFHGITEGYAIIQSADDGVIQRTKRVLARVRTDNVSTPVVDFPLNQLD